jgi:4-hydroxy-3-methylbut-2-en-1-yl diphosphate reductase
MNLILAQPRGFRRHVDLVAGAANRSNSNQPRADVINTLRGLGEVEVSTLPGREEHIEFRQPSKLALA